MLIVKHRQPAVTWILGIVTLGIYNLIWMAKICDEVQNVNPQGRKNVGGANAVLSCLFGFITLMIWPIINWFKFCESMKQQQQAVGIAPSFSTGVATLLVFVFGTHVIYVQSQQNLVVTTAEANAAAATHHPQQPLAA
ncbi:DUF4234 domain-containing protein [Natronoglycomyces albus]|uniref:DUF4234 domain-containing protein n=1 Tax=Natronoglycomyces albus TaxID=2811108 RepID=A0A895XGC5_9ACTN|nr:DUF4234 domain-containing protein [Natronoglycomyces albus]QSB04394.1 DUF4234 domain-containing protein [Natronoglycomyces albus]